MQGIKLNAQAQGVCACPSCSHIGSGLAGIPQGDRLRGSESQEALGRRWRSQVQATLRGAGVPEQMQCSVGATLGCSPLKPQPCCASEGSTQRQQRGGDMREISLCVGAASPTCPAAHPGCWASDRSARSHKTKHMVPLCPTSGCR